MYIENMYVSPCLRARVRLQRPEVGAGVFRPDVAHVVPWSAEGLKA